ncbi:DUF4865 family protein [Trinickia terrae]|uniref:DUF4865 family protein n=1 Tax=Trinickia terrae TaxID=2571161 RepID=A0A4U1HXT3_9BURK|nr:DUF4865 family protein [Trinickia terrae]TKC83906.1 DUF4865 family protein [Trinickia terrae]
MLTLHYPITLPADYDMSIIRHRVAERHAPFDTLAGLGFKAFLIRERESGAHVNEYAPFYIWTQPFATRDFLLGPKFDGVVQSFGRPAVFQGIVTALHLTADESVFRAARSMTVERIALRPGIDLAGWAADETELHLARIDEAGLLARAVSLEAGTWTAVRTELWAGADIAHSATAARYEVLHVSTPEWQALQPINDE